MRNSFSMPNELTDTSPPPLPLSCPTEKARRGLDTEHVTGVGSVRESATASVRFGETDADLHGGQRRLIGSHVRR